jgi:Ca-activated chloride channel homolog
MNVGNILPGEEIAISLTYAELYFWQGETLRFFLPTTLAPRYGDIEDAGLQPHQTPEYDLLVEHPFHFRLILLGILADAALDSPTHQLTIEKTTGKAIITSATGEDVMDRDFILNISSNQTEKDVALIEHDIDGGFVMLASFVPRIPLLSDVPPKSIKIVVDCSGSMAGDSISQARQAMDDILDHLRPQDLFNIIAFGSTHRAFFDQQAPADKENLTKARRLLRSLDADMGGTEMKQALQAAMRIPGPSIPQDIMLITDGEVWEGREIVRTVRKAGHRFFTVGVGSSVSEGFVRQLAKETGGACELVSPREKMADKIVRHFKRIYLPRIDKVAVSWPLAAEKTTPRDLGPIYDNDTLHIFARFGEKPFGRVALNLTLPDGRTLCQTAKISDKELAVERIEGLPGTIPRLAIHEALADENEADAAQLALQYQLVSPYTNYLVVAVRAKGEKAQDLPVLRKMPQMLAAGWGGSSSVVQERGFTPQVMFSLAPNREEMHRRRQQMKPDHFASMCNQRHTQWLRPVLQVTSYHDLLGCDLPDRILNAIEAIAKLCDSEVPEELIVVAFLHALTLSALAGEFNRNVRRAIRKAYETLRPDERLTRLMAEAFVDVRPDNWGPRYEGKDYAEQEAVASHD